MQALKKVPDFFIGGGEMGERMRNFDWNNTPLGAPENWDQALKTSLSICLNSNFPIALYWGKELTLLYNDAWSPIPGNKHPWALGKPAKEVWKDIWKEIEPEFKKAFEGIPGGSKDALLPMQRHGYTEECYFDFTFTPVTGTLGKVEGVFNAVIETTYRVISERRSNFLNQLSLALASANTQEKVFEQLNIFFKQNNTPVSFAFFYSENNGARNLFASTHNIKELHFKKQLPFKKVLELKKILLVERIHDYLESVPKGYWDEEPVEAVILPIADLNTSITHFIVCGLNARHRYDDDYKSFFESLVNIITKILNTIASLEQERKRAEALAEIDKAKTLFFTNISHEFRTPLTLMLGPIEEVLNDSTTNPANANRLALAHRNAMRLLKLVNALLDFSRIESGRQKTNFKLTDIVAFTKNLVSNFRSATEKAGLKLIVKANNNLPAVYVDRDMWEKIVFNLLSNAFKYTLKGSITVEITAQNNNAVLKIKDTGIGIPENELPRIFERFHRVQNIAGRSFEGTGIGLSLTKELVLLNRGKIFVESKEGVGSTFTVTVPFGKEHIDASEIKNDDGGIDNPVSEVYVEEASILLNNTSSQIETGNQLKNENQSKPLVIIVDDNIDMRKHIETLLSPKFNIVTAVNGADALKKLKHAKPELILSDIMMPVMDGIQLLTEIKNNKETEHIPVVLLTARAGEESKIEGWETGADDYLVKPFTAKELIARIEAQIKLKRKRDTALQSIYNIFREVPFAVAVLKGEDLIIEFINQYNLDIWQCKKDEVINKPLFEVRPDLYETAAPIHAEVYRTGKRFSANEIPLVLSANGKIETRYFNTVIDPLFNEDGNIIGQLATSIDVTDQVLARKQIEENEQRFRSMADEAPLFVWVTDQNLQTTFINKVGRIYFNIDENLNPSDLSWKRYIHPDDINMVLQLMQEAAEKHEPYTLEMRLKNGHTGNYHWFFDKGIPRFENNMLIGFIGTSLDIHDRKEAEAALRVAKEQLEVTFKNVPAGIYQFSKQGSIEYINERGAKLLGYESVEEVMAQPHMQQFVNHIKDTFIILDEEGNIRPDEKGSVYIAIATGKTAEVISQFVNKKNGTAAWLLSNSTPVYDDNGELLFILTTATDITESKKAELALRESENRFRTLAETLPHMVWVRNVINNTIEYGSKSWEDYSGIKDISNAWKEMVHPDDWKTVMDAWDRDSVIDKSFRYEVRLKNKQGEYRWHYTAGEPVKNSSGKIVKWIGAMTDIHMQKTFAEKLEQEVAQRTEELVKANKELESFNYIASHDLQEPLRKIQTFITLIEKDEYDSNLTQRYFEKIKSSARRMSELIQAILSYSRLSIKDYEYVPTDLNKILSDVETDFELLIKEKNANIQSNKLPVLKANPLQMHQLFSNLISNSLKFSKENPEIKITSQIVTGDKIKLALLTFADNGIGFDSQFKEQIFQLFQRLHGKQEYAGTGIGLSIVKKIVEQHKGFVTADSVDGKGATFRVWLPIGE